MRHRLARLAVTALLGVAALLGAAAAVPAAATTPPAPVSQLRFTGVYDHTLRATWSVPAAAYSAGARVLARFTRGYTPPATPQQGYTPAWVSYPHTVQARPLTSNAVYTFAVWVQTPSGLSARRTVTTRTLRDVTPPHALLGPSATPGLERTATPLHAQVTLDWQWERPAEVDHAGVRILRTASDWAHAVELTRFAPGTEYVDTAASLLRDRTYVYYLADMDTSGLEGPFSRFVVTTNARRIGGVPTTSGVPGDAWAIDVYDAAGRLIGGDGGGSDAVAWSADVRPGNYTVCEVVFQDPGEFQQFLPGCVGRDGRTYDWGASGFPAEAAGAVTVGAADGPSDIDLSLDTQ